MTYLVCFYSDGQLWISTQLILVCQWQQTDFVKCIRGIADQLPQEDLKGIIYKIDTQKRQVKPHYSSYDCQIQ